VRERKCLSLSVQYCVCEILRVLACVCVCARMREKERNKELSYSTQLKCKYTARDM
jgi:hypothetical protein